MQQRLIFSALALLLSGCMAPLDYTCEESNSCGNSLGGAGGTSSNGGSSGASASAGEGGTTPASGGGGSGSDGGNGNNGGSGGQPCTAPDPTASPADDACVIHEDYGVFASPAGDDVSGQGTRESPFATLAKAIEVATEANKRVYACATSGAYTEALRLDDTAADLALFGGFHCDTWAYSAEQRARLAPEDPQPVIATSADGLALHDLEIVAKDATGPSASSIALTLLDTDAALTRVTLTAGDGASGSQPPRDDFRYPQAADLQGCDAGDDSGTCSNANGSACTYTCPDGDTTTGGGRGSVGASGGTGLPLSSPNGGAIDVACANGGTGDNGNPGTDGSGADTHGTLDATGWTPAAGTAGGNGKVGQGGGGGSGGPASGTGGGGGCGGCGGKGAPGSTGGGSSIALLSHHSAVTLTECTLTASGAGDGGDAAEGQRGQFNPDDESVAGFGGLPLTPGCQGGSGGIGGPGGASGAGAGGLSVGILHDGPAPIADALTQEAVTTGTPGNGGAAVEDKLGTKGLDGVNDAILSVSSL